LTQTLN